jgi:hypothetical protein
MTRIMQWREYGIEQGELSCRETKTEILLLSLSLIYLFILRGIFQGVLVSHVLSPFQNIRCFRFVKQMHLDTF